jgi:NodT family efflux transporter outer membrane factor (OMF) lipoprotein
MTPASHRFPAPRPYRRAAAALAALALLAGCASPPPPPAAPPEMPPRFKEGALWQRAGAALAAEVPGSWWQLFDDPVLDGLQARLTIGNENLKFAVAQVAVARAALGGSRAAQEPTLSAGLSSTRSGSSGGGVQSSHRLDASTGWELDLWGRLAAATEASAARLQAGEDDLAAARLSAQATLTQGYLALRTAEAQRALVERSIVAYERSLALTRARYQAGVAPATDVLQAETQLKTSQVLSLEAASQRALAEHAIAVLLGQAPAELALAATARLPEPPRVPELLPATLLQRRPDIAAAERRVAAAQAQIGEAEAAFFPALTLTASAGVRESTLQQLLQAPTRLWSFGPALAQSLFDGGARRAASEQARAYADQAAAQYRQTVLGALQEVEDNLLLADQLQTQARLQRDAWTAAQRALDITQEQYRVGTVSYLNVVTAQAAALGSERSLLELQGRQLDAVNQLLKNIAGRW